MLSIQHFPYLSFPGDSFDATEVTGSYIGAACKLHPTQPLLSKLHGVYYCNTNCNIKTKNMKEI